MQAALCQGRAAGILLADWWGQASCSEAKQSNKGPDALP